MSNESIQAYPLTWPAGKPRTPSRRWSKFKVTFGQALDGVRHSLGLLGAHDTVISTNIPLRQNGLPYAEDGKLTDPGVAVYFVRKKKPICISCDVFLTPRENMRAIGLTLEALRSMERNGCGELLDQAFTGFAALPAHAAEPSWWDVLGVAPDASIAEIRAARDSLAQRHHPDVGGDTDAMARVNRAYEAACQERGEQ